MIATLRRLLICQVFLLFLIPPAQAQEAGKPVLVFAAASLQNALNAINLEWQKETGKKAIFSYASSSVLAKQIDNGAPADIFASADLQWMDWVQDKKLIKPETRKNLLGNALVLITQKDAPSSLKIAQGFPLAAALGDQRIAMGKVDSVPAGIYGKTALTKLGIWAAIEPHVASAESVRAALLLVAKGEAKYGIVYLTDAHSEKGVRVVDTFPEDSHDPIVYPFALVAGSANPDAQSFLAYLSTPKAIAIFEAEGFKVLK